MFIRSSVELCVSWGSNLRIRAMSFHLTASAPRLYPRILQGILDGAVFDDVSVFDIDEWRAIISLIQIPPLPFEINIFIRGCATSVYVVGAVCFH